MKRGEVLEVINYDPSLSILQNVYLAIGVLEEIYSLVEYDWKYILPEFYGSLDEEQIYSLNRLRKLIRDKAA
jgi:hypothetical protein